MFNSDSKDQAREFLGTGGFFSNSADFREECSGFLNDITDGEFPFECSDGGCLTRFRYFRRFKSQKETLEFLSRKVREALLKDCGLKDWK